ncbi:xylose isomerase domain-containing protein [Sphingomonas sp. MM-1]|uniref:sugar phosphate isomerase/epimerase family protein n=1 Tax=Sphingomonas sp. MM-1 TaxID=745310 RepID=UPI0002C0B479|nr:sugar phosphate isomerase/epimerase family protein [Sphingomonas sp. MM-1]AGH51268.1 xylose isomerase domain-containing protein [Sphingomonas sp. MM-1]
MERRENRLIACHWTIAGNQHPLRSDGTSPHSLPDRIRAAAGAGFSGIGFLHSDLARLLERYRPAEIARMLGDHGLTDIEVECLGDWFAVGERRRQSDAMRRMLIEFGAAVGARHLKLMGPIGEEWPLEHLAECYAGVAGDARGSGVRPAIELLPFSGIADPATGLKVVGGADGGLYLDIWHVRHGGIDDDQIRAIPIDRIVGIEINDAIPNPARDMMDATIGDRLPPGHGALDTAGFVRTMREIGYAGPIGVEIIADAHRALPLDEAVRIAFASATACAARSGSDDGEAIEAGGGGGGA